METLGIGQKTFCECKIKFTETPANLVPGTIDYLNEIGKKIVWQTYESPMVIFQNDEIGNKRPAGATLVHECEKGSVWQERKGLKRYFIEKL